MIISDAIRSAPTAHAVLFLTTSYVESLRHFHRSQGIPEFVVRLPIVDDADLRERVAMIEAVEDLAASAMQPVMEAFDVFDAAEKRLADFNEARDRSGALAL